MPASSPGGEAWVAVDQNGATRNTRLHVVTSLDWKNIAIGVWRQLDRARVVTNVSVFCKSYRNDLDPAILMVESVRRYNRDALPLYMVVPEEDLHLFKSRIGTSDVTWLTDDDVISANPDVDLRAFRGLPGNVSQQIVKAEFWRVNRVENSLCVDSDCRFIRDFFANDFLSPEGHPYTIMHEAKPFREFCFAHGIRETGLYFEAIAAEMRECFARHGPSYAFVPFPVIWSRKVWSALLTSLKADASTILDAVVAHPHEASWYGEALLKFRPIPLLPKEPLFKAYLYLEEYEHDRKIGMDEARLAQLYLGVVYQSNWYPRRLRWSKWSAYKVKRLLQRRTRRCI